MHWQFAKGEPAGAHVAIAVIGFAHLDFDIIAQGVLSIGNLVDSVGEGSNRIWRNNWCVCCVLCTVLCFFVFS